ncbi:hypothetical protein B484DRAFT_449075 [Ochromonadaceae sp. CCMP2298]|nr:hypothetical protein B484DRAFT_449075 [Ochromonadaceae sp. CCMP2298]
MAMALVAQPAWFDDEEDCHANLIGEEYKMKLKQDETVSKFQTNYWMQGQGIDWKAFESAKFLREIYRSCEWAPPITAGRNILVNSGDPILMHIASYLFGGKGAYGTYHEVLIYAFNLRGISKKHRLVFDWEKVAGVVTRGGTLAALKEEVRQEKRLVVRKTDALSVDSEYQTTKVRVVRRIFSIGRLIIGNHSFNPLV